MNKRNLEYYKCEKKRYFKSEYQSKPKDQIDYKNIWFLETEQFEKNDNSNLKMEKVNLNHQRIYCTFIIKSIMQYKIYDEYFWI